MKFEIGSQKLKQIIPLIDRIAGKHVTLPVLSCILIEVTGNEVCFRATNLDIGVQVSLTVKSEADGKVAVPSYVFSSLVSQISEQNHNIKIESVSGNINIISSHSKGVIKTVIPDDFPTIPKNTDGQIHKINSDVFVKGLSSVWYSASVSGVKPELCSVYVYSNNESLFFVATDSFRLAEKRIKTKTPISMEDMLIPFKNIPDIIRVLGSINEEINIISTKNLISFESKEVYLVSRLVDGVFPDYKQIIPKQATTEIVVLKQDFANALKTAHIFSDKFNQIRFVVKPKTKSFEIQTKNNDIGENQTTIPATLSGDEIEINFNQKYITDCLQSIESDSVSIELSGNSRPMVLKPISSEQNFMYLVMPMNR